MKVKTSSFDRNELSAIAILSPEDERTNDRHLAIAVVNAALDDVRALPGERKVKLLDYRLHFDADNGLPAILDVRAIVLQSTDLSHMTKSG